MSNSSLEECCLKKTTSTLAEQFGAGFCAKLYFLRCVCGSEGRGHPHLAPCTERAAPSYFWDSRNVQILEAQLSAVLAESMASDLDSFARHRQGGKKQSVKVNTEDVRMLDRRHDGLVRPPCHPATLLG